jgi:hypothetical protein
MLGATSGLLFALPAAAQQKFADDGRIVLGAERLTGLFFEKINITQTTTFDDPMGGGSTSSGTEINSSTTTFAILGTSTGLLGAAATSAGGTSMAPRLALDVFVASGFSVGGALTYVHSEGSIESIDDDGDSAEEDQPTFNGIVLAPRVGYALPLSATFAIWPRLGITYSNYWASAEDEGVDDMGNEITVEETTTLSFMDLTIEGMFAYTPVPNVAIVFGPFLDLGLFGSVVNESEPDTSPPGFEVETDFKYTSYGLTGGIALVF